MPKPKLSKLELQVMDVLWTQGPSSVRAVQDQLPGNAAYTTVQTMMVRLEAKKVLRRTHKVSNAFIFEATITRATAQRRLVDDFLSLFGGRMQPLMSHLVESRKLTLQDVQEAEKKLRELSKKNRPKR